MRAGKHLYICKGFVIRSDMSLIHFQKVSKIYSQNCTALEEVELKINLQEFVSIVGRSGSGKTTLLRLLIAEEKPTKGRVFFDKQDVHRLKDGKLPQLRRRIGMVFQDFKLLPQKTVYENVAFAMEAMGSPESEIKDTVPQVLDLVGLSGKTPNFPHELSGGEKQRVAIARALVHQPDVILADEPTGNLDPIHSWEIIRLLLKINELGRTVILATHNKEIVNTLGRRVVSLDAGRIVRDEESGKYMLY